VRSTRLFEVKFPLPLTPSRQGRENQHYIIAMATIDIVRRLRRGDATTIISFEITAQWLGGFGKLRRLPLDCYASWLCYNYNVVEVS
jgi:hypothetical protein